MVIILFYYSMGVFIGMVDLLLCDVGALVNVVQYKLI